MTLHFATIWETVADHAPGREAVVCDGQTRLWGDYEDRAARLATLFAEAGLKTDSKVGIYLHNSIEYLESQFAAFKIGGCPINVNYRYKADELVYLLDNSDAEAVVFQGSYAMRIWEIRERLPKIKLFVQVDDGSAETLLDFAVPYESLQRSAPLPRQVQRDDGVYMLYTGGTTGMPKGVMYPTSGFSAGMLGIAAAGHGLEPPSDIDGVRRFLEQIEHTPRSLPACPMMHGTGMWLGCMVPHAQGGTVIATSQLGLDPHRLWQLVQTQSATEMVIVGDAFARPLLQALGEAKSAGEPYTPAALAQIVSSGVMWSAETKAGLLEHLDVALIDIMGSSEGGMGMSVTSREAKAGTARFELNEGVKVFTEDDREVAPGSGEMGMIGTTGLVPIGYYKDERKSAATFREINGVRYSFPGDFATVEADGSITLLGRGSVCINTAGEKVFPEEVEEALKRHDDVTDALVVGQPDERFGERIVAVVAGRDGATAADGETLMAFAREQLAGYKAPRQVIFVPQVRRAPNGKADYKWARSVAEEHAGG